MDAFARGEVIQLRLADTWVDRPDPSWGCDAADYRIKPAPKGVHVLYKNDARWGVFDSQREVAEALASRLRTDEHNKVKNKWTVTSFVEVTT
jgi:hypothetical protein